VAEALQHGRPVVALETTLLAHGFPPGQGLAVGRACEERVRQAGAVPAAVAVLDGALRMGLSEEELERVAAAGPRARKAGPRDLAVCALRGEIGATTVGGTLAACRLAGVRTAATGGIGGVHRGFAVRPDLSADLAELARTQALVVCSGAKSLLDVAATAELLETMGVPVLGFRTDTLPLFYSAGGGPPVSARVEEASEAAAIARAHWQLGRETAVLLARPPQPELEEVEPLIEEALAEARRRGIAGQALTPFVLSRLHERSGGRTLEVNRRLAEDNAALAAEGAVALSRLP
jgi:pseudouridine-5'-phosphate glycosidase